MMLLKRAVSIVNCVCHGKSLSPSVLSGWKCFRSKVYSFAALLIVIAAIMASVLRIVFPFSSASSSILLESTASFFV